MSDYTTPLVAPETDSRDNKQLDGAASWLSRLLQHILTGLPQKLQRHPWVTAMVTFTGVAGAFFTFQTLQFNKDKESVEITLQLATYWESNLDINTRLKRDTLLEHAAAWAASPSSRAAAMETIAYFTDLNKMKELESGVSDPHIKELLKLNLDFERPKLPQEYFGMGRSLAGSLAPASFSPGVESQAVGGATSDSTAYRMVYQYRTALCRSLNVMETVATIRANINTSDAARIIDSAYAETIGIKARQSRMFIESFRQQERSQWQPLTQIFESGGAWHDRPEYWEK